MNYNVEIPGGATPKPFFAPSFYYFYGAVIDPCRNNDFEFFFFYLEAFSIALSAAFTDCFTFSAT